VRTHLDENGSRGRTAKRPSIHENTVSYRLRQAEELLGRSVDKRTLELRVALALADLADETPVANRGLLAPPQQTIRTAAASASKV
jgi:DNA-binding PucR family transcriptional regulator